MLSACVAALKSILILHHSADIIISGPLGSMSSFCVVSNIQLLKDLLEGINSVAIIAHKQTQ